MPKPRKFVRKVQISLGADATLPRKGSDGAAGLDLYTPREIVIQPRCGQLVDTRVSFAIPNGFYGKIFDRSSIATQGVTVAAGVIDSDYRGNVIVLLQNLTETTKTFEKGTRIAQMIICPHLVTELVTVDHENLGKTKRGRGGFGSTGQTKILPPRDMSPKRNSSNSDASH
jgi:dUTP pyrophosphatase